MEDKKITGESDLNKVLRRVRAAIALAEDPRTPADEADNARRKADALMLEYSIKEIGEQSARPATERTKPIFITIELGPDGELSGYFGWMADIVAKHCHCKLRKYSSWADGHWNGKVYGFEADVRYFEYLYTVIRLHMIELFIPRIDKTASLQENAYRLHTAGYNWLQIAELYGWRKLNDIEAAAEGHDTGEWWRNRHSGEVFTNFKVGGLYKRAYYAAIKAKGEQPAKIAAGGTKTYRSSAAEGYVVQIQTRLHRIAAGRQPGTELILGQRFSDVEDLFKQDNPELFVVVKVDPDAKPSKAVKVRARKYVEPKFNQQAYGIGVARANTADLNRSAGSTSKKEIS